MYVILVPAPVTRITQFNNNDQRVGQDLTLECEVTIVRGIFSTVDVVWIDNGAELYGMNNVTFSPVDNLLQRYTDTFTISPLRTSDDGRVIECLAVINSNPSVNDSGNITLSPTGTVAVCTCVYVACSSVLLDTMVAIW